MVILTCNCEFCATKDDGRLTQLGECLLDVEEVTGSSPVSSTTDEKNEL